MNRAGRVLVARTRVCRRELSTSSSVAVKEGAAAPAALPKAAPAPAAPPAAAKSKGGSTFFGRLSAFTAGSAVGLGAGYYYLNEEIKSSNAAVLDACQQLEKRVKSLERNM